MAQGNNANPTSKNQQSKAIDNVFNAVKTGSPGNHVCYELEDGTVYIDGCGTSYSSMEEAKKEWRIF